MNYAPIILFVYNRVDHACATIGALKENPEAVESKLYIYSDAPSTDSDYNDVEQVRDYVHSIDGFKSVEIIERVSNYGIEKQELYGITEILNKHGRAIVLEDDIQVCNQFLKYMNYCLTEYAEDKSIYTVTGYSFLKSVPDLGSRYGRTRSFAAWGWGTWNDRWQNLRWTIGKNDLKYAMFRKKGFDNGQDYTYLLIHQYKHNCLTWDVAWLLSCFEEGGLTIFPCNTMVNNIGMDGSGVHYNDIDKGNRIEDINSRDSLTFPFSFISDDEIAERLKCELREQNHYSIKKRIKMALRVRVNFLQVLLYGPKEIEIKIK